NRVHRAWSWFQSFFLRPIPRVLEIFQNPFAHEIDLLRWNAPRRGWRSRQLGMPRIARDIYLLVENLFAQFRLSARRGIRTASFIGAAGVKAEADQILR